jgi:hypothetical protein
MGIVNSICVQKARDCINRREKAYGEETLWELSDILLVGCGPPAHDNSHDGSYETMMAIHHNAREDDRNGYDPSYLSKIRKAGHVFPPETRRKGLPVFHHMAGKDPKMLGKVLARIGNKKPTQKLIADIRKVIEAEETPLKLGDLHVAFIESMTLLEKYEERGHTCDEGETQEAVVFEYMLAYAERIRQYVLKRNKARSHILPVEETQNVVRVRQ